MAESNKDTAASEGGMAGSESELTLQRWRQLNNGNLPNFQSPTQMDSWFDAQLMQVYSEVVSEPLPREFLDLLAKLSEKNKKSQ